VSGYLCSDLQQPTAKASFIVTGVRPNRTGKILYRLQIPGFPARSLAHLKAT